jgi:hypothetical protein
MRTRADRPDVSLPREAARMALLSLALLLLGCILASAAGAVTLYVHPPLGSFGPKGVGSTVKFKSPAAVAVDPGSQDVYVIDHPKKLTEPSLYRFTADGVPDPFTAGPAAGSSGMALSSTPRQVAIAPPGAPGGTAGDIYVVIGTNIEVYSSAGAHLGTIDGSGNPNPGGPEPIDLATDSAGNLYIAYARRDVELPSGHYDFSHLDKYVPSENPPKNSDFDSELRFPEEPKTGCDLDEVSFLPSSIAVTLTDVQCVIGASSATLSNRYSLAFPGSGGSAPASIISSRLAESAAAGTIATDPSTEDVYEPTERAYRTEGGNPGTIGYDTGFGQYDAAGNRVSFIESSGGGFPGIAVGPTNGRIYIVAGPGEAEERDIRFYGHGEPVEPPAATIDPVAGFDFRSAHFSGTVNPGGSGELQKTAYRFHCQPICPGLQIGRTVPSDGGDHVVSDDTTGLQPGTLYVVQLIARNVATTQELENRDGGTNSRAFPVPAELGEVVATTTFETPPAPTFAAPEVTINPVTGSNGTAATFSGTVNPNASEAEPTSPEVEAAYRTKWRFECVPDCDGGEGELAADNSPHAVEHEAHLLIQPNRSYTVKLVAENDGGRTVAETSFESPKVPPAAEYLPSAPVSLVNATEARLVGVIDPRSSGTVTECKFEYGLTAGYGSTVPCALEHGNEGDGMVFVASGISGLSPNTTYHFRLVAGNVFGSLPGADNHFTTFGPPPSDGSCPNEAVRIEQQATILPDCRAWEMVSPVEKNGGNIELEDWNTPTSPDGNVIGFQSKGGFGDTKGSAIVGLTQYVSRRGPDGWGEAQGITPTPPTNIFPAFSWVTAVRFMSEDLSHAVVVSGDLPQVSDDSPGAMNAYWEDTRSGSLSTITKSFAEQPPALEFLKYSPALHGSTSSDQRVIAFTAETRLLPEAPEAKTSVYEWEEGTLRLASYLPDGSLAVDGASNPGIGYFPGTVSPDGSLVTFLSPQEGQDQLYARRNHADTVWVSEPEGPAPVAAAKGVRLQYITPDSHHILFSTTSQLLGDDENSVADLYMYTDGPDPAAEQNLTLISGGKKGDSLYTGNGGSSVMATSDDGSHVYYLTQPGSSEVNVDLWKNGTRRRVIRLTRALVEGVDGDPGSARASADGSRFALMTTDGVSNQEEARGLTGLEDAQARQIYLYDDEKEMLFCASCLQAAPGSEVQPQTTHQAVQTPREAGGLGTGVDTTWPSTIRYLSSDGAHLFFSTEEALVREDKNEAFDVYEYNVDTGRQRLISSGRGEANAVMGNISADGGTVTFVTTQRLLARDPDTLRDLYVSRVDGGFAEPPPPPTPCAGDGCRGPIPPTPADLSPATPRFIGPGNPKPKHRKPHRHHRKKKHHQRRHHQGGAK